MQRPDHQRKIVVNVFVFFVAKSVEELFVARIVAVAQVLSSCFPRSLLLSTTARRRRRVQHEIAPLFGRALYEKRVIWLAHMLFETELGRVDRVDEFF